MSTPFNSATAAYGNAARLVSDLQRPLVSPLSGGANGPDLAGAAGLVSPLSTGGVQGPDFASVLAEAVQGVVDSGKVSDRKTMDMVNGKGDIVDVVTAISQTELAVETMVTVRDRVISAYEEIMRMPI